MKPPVRTSRWIRLSQAALWCCPRAFREEFGEELLDTVRKRDQDIGVRGGGLLWFHTREAWAVVRAGWRVRQGAARAAPAGRPQGLRANMRNDGNRSAADWARSVLADVRVGARALWRRPTHPLVAIVTLAVAVGAATAVFTVLNAIVLRPLPFPDAEQLVYIRDSSPPRFPSFSVSPGRFVEWQRRARAFEGIAATTGGAVTLIGAGEPERLSIAYASATLFDVLRVPPLHGRGFTTEEDSAGGPTAIVLSEGLWQSLFGGRTDVVGQTIIIDENPVTVVGVMPATFTYPSPSTRAWMPLRLSDDDRRRYGSHYLRLVGRIRPDVTVDLARQDLVRAARDLEEEMPDGNRTWTTLLDPLHDIVVGPVRGGLLLLVAAAGGVLLIACANVAGLLLARGADRQRDLAVRAALGASQLRLVRQLLVESALLGLAGSALGALMASGLLRALLSLSWLALPRQSEVVLDGSALAFAATLALVTPLVFGLLPASQLARRNAAGVLAAGGRTSASPLRSRTRSALIVVEVALAVMLVTGSGLLIRSLARLTNVDPGFDPANVLLINVSLPAPRYPNPEDHDRFFRAVVEAAAALPGIEHTAQSQSIPFVGDYVASLDLEGREVDPEDRPSSNFYAVSPGYFAAMGIPLLDGRLFTDADRADGPRVAIVSRLLQQRLFPGQRAVGRRIRISQGPREDFAEIVGLVGDVRQYDLGEAATMQLYEPARQHAYFRSRYLVLRTTLPPESVTGAVRHLMTELDARLPVVDARRLDDVVAQSTGPRRFTTALLVGLALVALLLAAVGAYALVSFVVGRRTQEFGIRMALGAAPGQILRLVLGQGMRLGLAGICLGLAGAFLGTTFIEAQLFEVSARDPVAFVVGPAGLLAAVGVACWWPARRAVRVNTVSALRDV